MRRALCIKIQQNHPLENGGPVQWELVTHRLEPPYSTFFFTGIVVTANGGIHLIPVDPRDPWDLGEENDDEEYQDGEDTSDAEK